MTDLARLNVSLTKQGAYRIFPLLRDNDPVDWEAQAQALSTDAPRGQKIDLPQFRKTLAAQRDGANWIVPDVWQQARESGVGTLRDLFLIGMLLSHHTFIRAMRNSQLGRGEGRLDRERDFNQQKDFTNFRGNLRELGFVRDEPDGSVTYDFSSFFENNDLPPLVAELLRLKLLSANWGEGDEDCDDLVDECVRLGLYEVFGLSPDEFRDWLQGHGVLPAPVAQEELAAPDRDQEEYPEFNFVAGHRPGQEGQGRRRAARNGRVEYIHNQLQTSLFNHLVGIHGEDRVGTEQPAGVGQTLIDIAVREANEELTFYEIKTNVSVRLCIREALSQVLEYAYWPGEERASKLVIVSPHPVTTDAANYLRSLRERFHIPVYYRSFNVAQDVLSEEH